MPIQNVLIVDQQSPHHIILIELLRKKKANLIFATSLSEALCKLAEIPFDLIFGSIEENGSELLTQVKSFSHSLPIVLYGESMGEEVVCNAMEQGAFHCLNLPATEGSLLHLFSRVQEHLDRERIASFLPSIEKKKEALIAESAPMKQILIDIGKIAKSSSSVFISGESGTGKEVIAAAIHNQSHRTQSPFIKVNCAAIPATLLESEFFGHEKGAFTGALQKKQGRFELAHQGTLLLDEISEIPLELQAKLLRAIQEMEFERVGGVQLVKVDVRLIATSNRSMKEAIEQKLFREDLYYRLNVIPIQLPPLRERKEDIIPLAEFFLSRLCEENHKPQKRLCIDAKKKLTDYSWPGNIRELANVIERSVIMNPSITLEAHQIYLDLACPIKESPLTALPVGLTLAELEKRLILQTLQQEGGNRTKTASILGISLRTLRNKLNTYVVL